MIRKSCKKKPIQTNKPPPAFIELMYPKIQGEVGFRRDEDVQTDSPVKEHGRKKKLPNKLVRRKQLKC
jgi:hypothetical protein